MAERVLFRADSSSTIGLGHIKRDLVYASRLDSNEISFAVQALEGNINHLIPYPLHLLETPDVNELIKLCNALQITHLVIDNYALDDEDEKKIKKNCDLKLSVFDDTYKQHYCDEIINHNMGADARKYRSRLPLFCNISLIPPLIRKEFALQKKHRQKKSTVFVSLGGTDPKNLSLKVLKALKRNRLPVDLATTSSNPHLDSLKAYARVNPWLSLHIDADIPKLMNRAFLAIVTPSVLAAEAAYMDTEVISLRTADNQIEIERFLKKQRFQTLSPFQIHKLKDLNALRTRRHYRSYFEPKKYRQNRLIKATIKDLDELFTLANDPYVRQNSFSQEPIALQTHTRWLKTVLADQDTALYVVRSGNDDLIAQLRFDRAEGKSVISVSLTKAFRGQGLAADILEKACTTYLREHPDTIVEAHIKKENLASQKSFEKAGFKLMQNNQSVLIYHYGETDA